MTLTEPILPRRQVSNAMARAASSSSYFSSTPLAAAMINPWHRLIVFCIMVYMLFGFIDVNQASTSSHEKRASIYQFTALKERGGNESMGPGIDGFRLGVDGCVVLETNAVTTQDGASIMLDYGDQQQRMTGWFIKTREGQDPEHDPVQYKIESFDPQEGWAVVGGSSWYYSATTARYTTSEDMEIPMTRGVWMEVDPSMPVSFMVYFRCSQVLLAPSHPSHRLPPSLSTYLFPSLLPLSLPPLSSPSSPPPLSFPLFPTVFPSLLPCTCPSFRKFC